jgi:hypothetical protein
LQRIRLAMESRNIVEFRYFRKPTLEGMEIDEE